MLKRLRDNLPQLKLGLILVASLLVLAQWGCLRARQQRIDALTGSITATKLELAGAQRALEASPKEVLKVVERLIEVPVPIKEAIHRGETTAVAAVVIKTETKVVEVPGVCPDASGVSLGNSLEGALLVTWTPPRFVHTFGTLRSKVTIGPTETTFTFDKPEDVQVTLADDLLDRLERDYRRGGWFKRHFRTSCPTVAVVYDVVDGDVAMGPGCAFGFTWD